VKDCSTSNLQEAWGWKMGPGLANQTNKWPVRIKRVDVAASSQCIIVKEKKLEIPPSAVVFCGFKGIWQAASFIKSSMVHRRYFIKGNELNER
jgi:hypothetical protein